MTSPVQDDSIIREVARHVNLMMKVERQQRELKTQAVRGTLHSVAAMFKSDLPERIGSHLAVLFDAESLMVVIFATVDNNYNALRLKPGNPAVVNAQVVIARCMDAVGDIDQFVAASGTDLIKLPDNLDDEMRKQHNLSEEDLLYLIKI